MPPRNTLTPPKPAARKVACATADLLSVRHVWSLAQERKTFARGELFAFRPATDIAFPI
jgi:hypothetical protein